MADITRKIGLSLGADICWPICYEALLEKLDLRLAIDPPQLRGQRAENDGATDRREARRQLAVDGPRPDRVQHRFNGGDQNGLKGGHVLDGNGKKDVGEAHLKDPEQ